MVVDVAGFGVGLMTCYDLRFPELARLLVDHGAEVLVVPAAWVAGPRKVDHWRTLVRARAIENTVFVVAAAQPGPRYTGHSLVVDPLGDVLAEAGEGAEVLRATLDQQRPRGGPAHQPLPRQPKAALAPLCNLSCRATDRPSTTRDAPRAGQGPRPSSRRRSPDRLATRSGAREARAGSSRSPPLSRARAVPDDRPVQNRLFVALWLLVVAGGLAALVAALVPAGPPWLDGVGAVAVVTAYSWGLAARTGGRPVVFGGLALVLGVAVLLLDQDYLRTGAAVMTCVVSAVLAVMATTPAVRFVRAARECVVAVLIAAIGAMATIGFDPVVSVVRFEYVTLGLALVGAFAVVYRLGAGLHGLGRRGLLVVRDRRRAARGHPAVRRDAAPLRLAGPGRPPARRRPLEPRPPRRLPAPDRDRPRRPGARLGLSHARPAPAGLVAVRVRRRRDRPGRQLRWSTRRSRCSSAGSRCCTGWSSAW